MGSELVYTGCIQRSVSFGILCATWKKACMLYANSECPDVRAHPCSLIWMFSVRRHVLPYPFVLKEDNEGQDQPAQMRRLIRAFVVKCAGWSGPSLSSNCIKALFVHWASHVNLHRLIRHVIWAKWHDWSNDVDADQISLSGSTLFVIQHARDLIPGYQSPALMCTLISDQNS